MHRALAVSGDSAGHRPLYEQKIMGNQSIYIYYLYIDWLDCIHTHRIHTHTTQRARTVFGNSAGNQCR